MQPNNILDYCDMKLTLQYHFADLHGDVCLHDNLPDGGEVHVHGAPPPFTPPPLYPLLAVPGSTWHGLLAPLHPPQLFRSPHRAHHLGQQHISRHGEV